VRIAVSDILTKTAALSRLTFEFVRDVVFLGRVYDFYLRKHQTLIDFTGHH
jgi:putative methionine-R-sulfoxide reductase with GAF domain